MNKPQLLVFSDLDGTLLDHDSYGWRTASVALEKLKTAGIPLILNSSKTASEIRSVREELGNDDPFIVENGAAVVIPAGAFGAKKESVINFGAPRQEVLTVLAELRRSGARFRGFEDMTSEQLASVSGLTADAATRAKQRLGTEPLLWDGTEDELAEFSAALAARNLRLVQGGRFYHAMGVFDKADGARFLLSKYREQVGDQPTLAIALGDSPNDQQMLEAADIAVVIRGVNSDKVQLLPTKRAMRSLKAGPEGWNACVLNLLLEYGY